MSLLDTVPHKKEALIDATLAVRKAAFLLVGQTGSGKTIFAQRRMEPAGAVRLSVDEEVFARHGRYAVDDPEDAYFEREAPVVAEVRQRVVDLRAGGTDAAIDHGL